MNFSTHGLHITWPQGLVSIAFVAFERLFLQLGHILVVLPKVESASSVKLTVTNVFKE